MRHLLTRALAGVVALGWLASAPSAALACISDSPTFAQAVNGASAIARVTVVEGFDPYTEDPSRSETYRVDRVLKGNLPHIVTVAPAWTSLCHDSIGYYAGREGTTIVVAFGLASYGEVINPMWGASRRDGVWGSAGVPRGVATLADLEGAILAKLGLPDTATGETGEVGEGSEPQILPLTLLLSTTGVAAFAVALWRIATRQADRGIPKH